ncbi:MAG: helix-turn-helix transcriptional regulator [Paenalcaligenes sp.]
MKDLPATIRLSRTQIYKLIKAGEFPRPVSLGGTAVAWRHEDLEEWKANLRPL